MDTISPVYARLVLRELEQNNIDTATLFRAGRLTPKALMRGGDIPLEDFLHILREGQRLAPESKLGFMLGRNTHTFALGPLGAGMSVAPSLREGLQLLESFTRLHASYVDIEAHSSPNGMTVFILYRQDTGDMELFHTQTAMMLLQQYVETTIGQTLSDATYHLAFPTPDNQQDYREAIHGDTQFGARVNRVEIPRRWLDLPSPYFHNEMWQQAQQSLSKMLAEQGKTENNTFTRHIRALLQSSEPPLPDLDNIARRLHVSQRTLNRRLQTEGTSYRQLKSDSLINWAKIYLSQTSDSVESIAATLGYQDAANFRRAFRKQENCSPNDFRLSGESG